MGKDEGFINERTGKYVSPERAHQHVGEEHAFGGYEKAQSKETGNFYMREVGSSYDLDDDAMEEARKALKKAKKAKKKAKRELEAMRTSYPGILSRDGRSGR